MVRPLSIALLACCGILLAASQSPQTTDMAGARANVSNETIEGLVRMLPAQFRISITMRRVWAASAYGIARRVDRRSLF